MRWILPALLLVVLAAAAAARARQPDKLARAQRRRQDLLASRGLATPLRAVRVVVRKAARSLELRARFDGDAEEVSLLTCPVGLGGAPEGHKQREGDQRTPEGLYYVCTRNERSRFHLFLGLSYPGIPDAEAARAEGRLSEPEHQAIVAAIQGRRRPPWDTPLGGQIGIHGYGSGSDWTLGCVALEDEQIETLWAFCPLGTPVEVLP